MGDSRERSRESGGSWVSVLGLPDVLYRPVTLSSPCTSRDEMDRLPLNLVSIVFCTFRWLLTKGLMEEKWDEQERNRRGRGTEKSNGGSTSHGSPEPYPVRLGRVEGRNHISQREKENLVISSIIKLWNLLISFWFVSDLPFITFPVRSV